MYLASPKLTRSAIRPRSFIITAAIVAFLLFGSVFAWAYDSAHDQQIAKGVTAGGVDIGGLSVKAARKKLKRELSRDLERNLTVVFRDHRFDLDAARAGVHVDVKGMVDDALQKSRGGNIVTRTFRGVFGGSVEAHVPAAVKYSHSEVDAFVRQVAAGVNA